MEARQIETTRFEFASVEDIRKELQQRYTAEYTFERWCQFRDWILEHQDLTLQWLNKMTIKDLKGLIYARRGDEKKAQLVEQAHEALIGSFDISTEECRMVLMDFSGNWKERERQQLIARVNAVTPEVYEAVRADRIAAVEARRKALTNPETKDEFEIFIRVKSAAAMTPEQRARYDDLFAEERKAERQREQERNAVARKVDIENVEMTLIKTTHTKKGHDLWVVQLSDRIERDKYNELNTRAKQLGGYYSSFRGNGAVPGFQFDTPESAELFMKVKDEDVNTVELLWQRQEAAGERRSVVLQSKGQALIEEGEAALAVERKDNTARRARMASNAEQNAVALIELGKVLIAVGNGMETGQVRHLEYLNNVTEIDQLFGLIRGAEYRYRQEKNIRYGEDVPYTTDLADHVRYPYPVLYRNHVESILLRLQEVKGKQMAARRMLKRLRDPKLTKDDQLLIANPQRLADFKTLFIDNTRGLDQWAVDRYKKELLEFNRIYEKLKLQTLPELRAAIRELITIEHSIEMDPEQKRLLDIRNLERKFVGKKIEGFFPTPRELAEKIVRLAGIEAGHFIIEPEAGLGHIADVISELYPDADLLCIEQYYPLVEALQLKGYVVKHGNFLEETAFFDKDMQELRMPDRIIMNPPFENGQDCEHVQHAFKLLKPGGRLVAIMAGNKYNSRNTSFMQWLEDVGGTIEQNPEGSFASAFRPTGVATCTVVLDKPE